MVNVARTLQPSHQGLYSWISDISTAKSETYTQRQTHSKQFWKNRGQSSRAPNNIRAWMKSHPLEKDHGLSTSSTTNCTLGGTLRCDIKSAKLIGDSDTHHSGWMGLRSMPSTTDAGLFAPSIFIRQQNQLVALAEHDSPKFIAHIPVPVPTSSTCGAALVRGERWSTGIGLSARVASMRSGLYVRPNSACCKSALSLIPVCSLKGKHYYLSGLVPSIIRGTHQLKLWGKRRERSNWLILCHSEKSNLERKGR